jgi:hypothetical protein
MGKEGYIIGSRPFKFSKKLVNKNAILNLLDTLSKKHRPPGILAKI